VLLLDKLEKGGHVGTTKVIDGLQACEHALFREPLEVILTNVLKKQKERAVLDFGLQMVSPHHQLALGTIVYCCTTTTLRCPFLSLINLLNFFAFKKDNGGGSKVGRYLKMPF
jgi:hypothetical protein